MANLINLERVSKSYGVRPLLDNVSLGISLGERVGVVGRNGDGKTTLLEVMTGIEQPDTGRVSRTRGVEIGYLHQGDELVDSHSVREAVLGGRQDHEWAADPTTRQVVEELLAGVTLDRAVVGLSGGERRRCALAALLLSRHDLIVLDEPTNHLDVEAVAWLAGHLVGLPSALIVVTHDRWFLDAVCQTTWEVHDGAVDSYEGGYAAYVLAKAERQRQAAATETRRQNLARKELAWLRRGAPARTSKPKFRIDAANALIDDVPDPRDRLELQRFASQRLGKDVIDIEDVDLKRGERVLLDHATWRIGPGDRIGIVGVNGAGKTSLLSLIAGTLDARRRPGEAGPDGRDAAPHAGARRDRPRGAGAADGRVDPAGQQDPRRPGGHRHLAAGALRLHRRPAHRAARRPVRWRAAALPAAQAAADRAQRAAPRRADQRPRHRHPQRPRGLPRLLARHAHRGLARPLLPRAGHRLRLGAPRRRAGLDAAARGGRVPRAPGRIRLVRRPRRRWWRHLAAVGLSGRDLPPPPHDGGGTSQPSGDEPGDLPPPSPKARAGSAEDRAARKVLARVEKQLERIAVREAELHAEMEANLTDYDLLARVGGQLGELAAEKDELEMEWLEASEVVE